MMLISALKTLTFFTVLGIASLLFALLSFPTLLDRPISDSFIVGLHRVGEQLIQIGGERNQIRRKESPSPSLLSTVINSDLIAYIGGGRIIASPNQNLDADLEVKDTATTKYETGPVTFVGKGSGEDHRSRPPHYNHDRSYYELLNGRTRRSGSIRGGRRRGGGGGGGGDSKSGSTRRLNPSGFNNDNNENEHPSRTGGESGGFYLQPPNHNERWHDDDEGSDDDEDDEMDKDGLVIVGGGKAESENELDDKKTRDIESEALASMKLAVEFRDRGKFKKAERLFAHAIALYPKHPDILTEYGMFMELSPNADLRQAETMYTRALMYAPGHPQAITNRERTLPLVEEIDNKLLSIIDDKRHHFLEVPRNSASLRRAMKEAYFLHIYHTVAMEGNTMSLVQTRSILETHLAVGGKSVIEHNEILGMDQALRYLNKSMAHRIGAITVGDIKEIHHRVLGFVDPASAGRFRSHQVYVGDFTPIPAEHIQRDMDEFVEWLNSDEALSIHPVEMAAIAHYKFVFIHPFVDGNGRTARLLMNLILMQAGFPPVIIRVEDRLKYYETLGAANEGDLRPFIRFIASATDRTLSSYLAATSAGGGRNNGGQKAGSHHIPLRNIGQRETPTSGELMKKNDHHQGKDSWSPDELFRF